MFSVLSTFTRTRKNWPEHDDAARGFLIYSPRLWELRFFETEYEDNWKGLKEIIGLSPSEPSHLWNHY